MSVQPLGSWTMAEPAAGHHSNMLTNKTHGGLLPRQQPHRYEPRSMPCTHLEFHGHVADRQLQPVDQHGHHMLHEAPQHATLAPRRRRRCCRAGCIASRCGRQRCQLSRRQLGLLCQPGAVAGGPLFKLGIPPQRHPQMHVCKLNHHWRAERAPGHLQGSGRTTTALEQLPVSCSSAHRLLDR